MRLIEGRSAQHLPTGLAVAILCVPTIAHAQLYDRTPPRIEVDLELVVPLLDADDAFAELRPGVLFGIGLAAFIARDLSLGLVTRAALTDPTASHYEVLADLTWSWVDEPRLPDPPALRVALSFEVGWRFDELVGSDFVVTDHGLMLSIAGALGLVVFEDVALGLELALVTGTASNGAISDGAPKLRLGFTLGTLF